jgi:putative inorganic carbon (HCO3(-)) transporter
MALATPKKLEAFCDAAIVAGLAFVVFFLPVYNALTSFGLGVAIFFFLLRFGVSRFRFSFIPLNPAVFFYVFACLASALSAGLSPGTIVGLRKLALHVFFYFAVVHACRNEKNRNFLIALLIATSIIVSLDGLFQWATGSDWFSGRPLIINEQLNVFRVTGSFLQAGALGIYLGGILPIAACLTLFFIKGKRKAWAVTCILMMIGALALTLAPGAALGFSAMLVFVCALKRIRWPILVIAAFFLAAFFLLPESLTGFPDGRLFESFNERSQMWKISFSLIGQHPLMGAGINTFGQNYAAFAPEGSPYYHLGTPYAHNMYIQILAETGLIGLVSFFAFIFFLFRSGLKALTALKENPNKTLILGFLAALIAYFTHGLLESSFQTSQGAMLFWLLAGMTASFFYHVAPNEVK